MQRQLSVAFNGIDSDTPLNEPLSAKYMKSFAYFTLKERLPVILTTVVDSLVRHREEITKGAELAEADLKKCIGKISKLKNEVQTNKTFIDLCSNGEDVSDWNDYLALERKVSSSVSWFESTWLYSECYMYRRLREIFETSETLDNFDYFSYQKEDSFEKNLPEVKMIADYTLDVLSSQNEVKEREVFSTLMKASLWGNRCDLSISAGSSISGNQHNLECIKSLDGFLLHDDTDMLYELLLRSRINTLMDFVTDNAGYELFCDLCFCDYLCTSGLATKIRFHVKKFPWYVSDATANDIKWLISKLMYIGLEKLAHRWESYFSDCTWTISDEHYWTSPHCYSEMKNKDVVLYSSLSESSLVIFKGDLNYRKLLGDINWDFSEKLDVVLREFRPTNIVGMRTIKSDLICGLVRQKYEHLLPDLTWMRTGEYAVIQLCCKHSQQ